ncbi:DUF6049 family protein [Streptomyces termitum]|uniref:Uncharacterized protein n=1 Tax=Streptomyces termitum TaxID=67368 RepID=A0A918WD39_9ACTN|nr:DUF6049 family protein [Streptomyces termitum]GHB03280.1 hypothetical protein GCM10010305_53200 [Streptomyces termitum]
MAEAAAFQGTGPSPARRWLRRTLTVAVGAPLLAGLLQSPSAPPAEAAEGSGSRTVDVSIDTLAPSAPVEGDTVTVTGTLTNRGKRPITDATVNLRVGPRMDSRSEIGEVARRKGFRAESDPQPLESGPEIEIPRLEAGVSRDFQFSVPVSKLGLDDEGGVYQLGVSLTGQTSDQRYDHVLGIERTFLPYQPEPTSKRTQVTYLWPLISSSHISADTASDDQQSPVFQDDDLAEELRPGGRLDELVTLGKDLPVTWVIDPDLLASVDAMANGYRIKDGTGHTAGTDAHSKLAARWLGLLEKAVQGHKVVALPFADPDLASLAHRGKAVPGALENLQSATELAGPTIETILHVQSATDFAWPVEGAVDPSVMAVATSAGARKVIARSDSIRDDELAYTPTAARPLGGGTTAVVSDAELSTAFQGEMVRAENTTLAVQEFLSQTLAVTLEQPQEQRSIVVAPQRQPSVAQAQAMAAAVRGLGAKRWSEPTDLVTAAAAKPDPEASTSVPRTAQYPKRLRDGELPVQAFRDMKTTRDELDDFKVVLTMPDRVVPPVGSAINREMSTSWRGRTSEAAIYRVDVEEVLQRLTKSIQLVDKSDLTLSGRSATIPVTVQNKLLQDVDGLVLRLTSANKTRLKVDGEAMAELPLKVRAGHSQSVKFPASANANGQVSMTAQLYTADGTPYGLPMSFTVKVSEMTPTVMLVIAGGVLLLVLAGVRMYTQRKRLAARAAAEAETETDAETEAETEPGTDDEPENVPTAESGSESDSDPDSETVAEAGTEPLAEKTGPEAESLPEPDEQTGDAPEDRSPAGDGTPATGREAGGDTADDAGQPSDPDADTGSESGDPSGTGEKVDR